MNYPQSLPVELLAHIFMLATHGDEETSFSPYSVSRPIFNTTSVKVPVTVSCVNRYWRHVALNTPALWTSLCITPEMIVENDYGRNYLNSSFLDLYLVRSQMYPLDVLIDARDPTWSFNATEPECVLFMLYSYNDDLLSFFSTPFQTGPDVYWPLFSPHFMLDVVSSLIPHIHRWRSLEILTDVWAPMFVALSQINPFLMSRGAPRLEYLALSRCNEFASFSPSFYPGTMKNKPLFSPDEYTIPVQYCDSLLPSLRHLKLQGVHVHWSMLSLMLMRQSNVSLVSLELDYHSRDVRPSLEEFHQILSSSSQLETLKIRGSGPVVTDLDDDVTLVHHDCRSISLPNLKDLTIGYHDMAECQTILELLDAPSTRKLHLEDETYKAEPEELDAGPILSFLATGEFSDFKQKTPSSVRVAFPGLTSLSLSSVKTGRRSFNAFLSSVKDLRDLSVNSMDLEEILYALLPSNFTTLDNSILCPCPRLEKLTLMNVDPGCTPQCYSAVGYIDGRRREYGSTFLRDFDVQEVSLEYDDEDFDIDCELDEGAEFIYNEDVDDLGSDRSFMTVAL